jgi:hypothetical protein
LWTPTPLPSHFVQCQHAIVAASEEHFSYHHILPKPAHIILAQISLNVLLHLNDEMDKAYFPHAICRSLLSQLHPVHKCIITHQKGHEGFI